MSRAPQTLATLTIREQSVEGVCPFIAKISGVLAAIVADLLLYTVFL